MVACSLARTAFASDSARPSSASVPPTTGRPIVTSSVVSPSPVSVLASSRTVHRIRPALVVRPQPGQSARDRQAACPRFLTLPEQITLEAERGQPRQRWQDARSVIRVGRMQLEIEQRAVLVADDEELDALDQ